MTSKFDFSGLQRWEARCVTSLAAVTRTLMESAWQLWAAGATSAVPRESTEGAATTAPSARFTRLSQPHLEDTATNHCRTCTQARRAEGLRSRLGPPPSLPLLEREDFPVLLVVQTAKLEAITPTRASTGTILVTEGTLIFFAFFSFFFLFVYLNELRAIMKALATNVTVHVT